MFDLVFWVNSPWITYFISKLHQDKDFDLCLADSQKACSKISFLWDSLSSEINQIIEYFFWNVSQTIYVEVYPEYFLLGAIHVEKWIIVLWQVSRSPSFYWWLLLHELIHFALKDAWLNRLVEETICFLFERMFILQYDGISIDDFAYEKWTDLFHTYAIWYSKTFFDVFIWFYDHQDLPWLIVFLTASLDQDKQAITIKNSLTAYLSENG